MPAEKPLLFIFRGFIPRSPDVGVDDWLLPSRISRRAGLIRTCEFRPIPDDFLQTIAGIRVCDLGEEPTSFNGVIQSCELSYEDLCETFPQNTFIQRPICDFEAIGWHGLPETDSIWVQGMPARHVYRRPCTTHPVVQSYLDKQLESMVVRFGSDFAREWLDTTANMSPFWLNDRLLARRPWIHCPMYKQIDAMCSQHPPAPHNMFGHRQLEEEYAISTCETRTSTEEQVKESSEESRIPDWSGRKLENAGVTHFLFGFGSLINTRSRLSSAPSSTDAIYVRVSADVGYVRAWVLCSYACRYSICPCVWYLPLCM